MSDINFRLIERLFERKEEQTGYYIGERRVDTLEGRYMEIVLFSFPPDIQSIINANSFEELSLIDAHKINNAYTNCNISLKNEWAPFQQYYINIDNLDGVYPLFKFNKNTLKELLNLDERVAYKYAEFVNNTDENSATNE